MRRALGIVVGCLIAILLWIGVVVWLPYLFAGFGNIGAGYLSNWLQQRGEGLDRSRRIPLVIGAILLP